MNQLQNSPGSSQQTSGMFLFGIQNNQLMAMGQPGQPQNEGQPPVTTLLSQQMPENSPLASSINTNQNIEKMDLLVSLQNQGNNLTGSF